MIPEDRLPQSWDWKQQQMKFIALNAQLGFDRPFFVQYGDWIVGVLHGDWGNSYFLHESVSTLLGEYFLPTISLAIFAQIIALFISIPLDLSQHISVVQQSISQQLLFH
ncbi:MAG: hypothetical protein ACLUO9_03695 [Coprococcus comes]